MSDNRQYKVVQYLNQFYAGKGGEEFAHISPYSEDGAVGPGRMLEATSLGKIKIVGTVVCGDNNFVEDPEAVNTILEMIKKYEPDGVIAGPAFLAGRYGEACTEVCNKVQEELKIPVITGLAEEHPSVGRFKKSITIVKTGKTGADMRKSLPVMGELLTKLINKEEFSIDEIKRLFSRGLKKNIINDNTAAKRSVDMLLKKYNNESFATEIPIPANETIKPAPSYNETPMRIALITDGGLMYSGNPERMPSGRCERYYEIDIKDWETLSADNIEVNHFGYDTRYVVEDPNRLVPLDVARDLEKAGKIIVHPILFTTAGVATAMENAARFGKEIAEKLRDADIGAAILTST